jgi:hypothetical protein
VDAGVVAVLDVVVVLHLKELIGDCCCCRSQNGAAAMKMTARGSHSAAEERHCRRRRCCPHGEGYRVTPVAHEQRPAVSAELTAALQQCSFLLASANQTTQPSSSKMMRTSGVLGEAKDYIERGIFFFACLFVCVACYRHSAEIITSETRQYIF